MDTSSNFTDDEKRFVLSEIIRTSQVDVEMLARFVAFNDIQPQLQQWLTMQIPQTRNVNQCMHVAEQLRMQASQLKRKRSNEHIVDGYAKRPGYSGGYVPGPGTSHHASIAIAPAPVNIAPRPSNGHRPSPLPSPPPPVSAPKKRGRPSRADKAKRDLRPLLPQHLVPRPTDHSPGAHEPRPILPAPAAERYSKSPVSNPRASVVSTITSKQTMSHVDMTRPRVLSDDTMDRIEKTRAYLGSELPPIEQELRASMTRDTPHGDSPTTLAPLLPRNSPGNADTPSSQAARSTPVTNSV